MGIVRKFLRFLSIYDTDLVIHLNSNNNMSYNGSGNSWTNIGNTGSSYNHTITSLTYDSNNKYFTGNGRIDLANGSSLSPITTREDGTFIAYTHEIWVYFNTENITSNSNFYISSAGEANRILISTNLSLKKINSITLEQRGSKSGSLVTQTSTWTPTTPLSQGWYHIIAVVKQKYPIQSVEPNDIKMFVNTNMVINSITDNNPIFVGTKMSVPTYFSGPFNFYPTFGQHLNSNVTTIMKPNIYRLYNRALSFTQIQQNFNSEKSIFGIV